MTEALAPGSAVEVRLSDLLSMRAMAGALGTVVRRATSGLRPGQHQRAGTVLPGRGLAFAESRPYQRGDDVRSIDWRVTARQGRPHTKVFEDERERPLWIVVDRGQSMSFGSQRMFKSVLAARAAAWIAWSGRASGDRVGACLVDPAGVQCLRPTPGDRGVIALLQALCQPPAASEDGADLTRSITQLQLQVKSGDRVFVLSDFYGFDDSGSGLLSSFGSLLGRAETVLLRVVDPLEMEPPPGGRYPVMRAGAVVWLDLDDPAMRQAWREGYAQRTSKIEAMVARYGGRLITLSTHQPLAERLGALV